MPPRNRVSLPKSGRSSSSFSEPPRTATTTSSARPRGRRRKRLDVAIVGAPNAGKSQLLNALAGTTLAAVSRKRHTTRSGLLGARTIKNTQLVFVDTPGFLREDDFPGEGGVRGEMRDLALEAEASLERVDYTLVVVDAARRIDGAVREALVRLMIMAADARGREEGGGFYALGGEEGLGDEFAGSEEEEEEVRERFAIVLNKVDLVKPKTRLLEIAEDLGNMGAECVRYIEGFSKFDHDREEENADEGGDGPLEARSGDAATVSDGRDVADEEEAADSKDTHAGLDYDTAAFLTALYPPVFFVSARYDDVSDPSARGLSDVMRHLLNRATLSKEWPVAPARVTDMTPLERAEEIIREKIYRCLHREVPHRVEQVNRLFRAVRDGGKNKEGGVQALRIDQDLVVRTESHRRLVMGRGGVVLRRMEDDAKRDLERAFGCNVALNLHVKLTKSRQRGRVNEAERAGVVRRDYRLD